MRIIENTVHSRRYIVKPRNPENYSENVLGLEVVKLEEPFTFKVYGKEYTAEAGQYLAQCLHYPPKIISSWQELNKNYVILRKPSREFQRAKISAVV